MTESASFVFSISRAATPTFSPVAGSYLAAQTVSISCSTAGSAIYYTTDGSTPTTSSAVYSTPLTVGVNETLTAIATASGFTQSLTGSAAYTFPQVATPTFSPVAGAYLAAQTVSISCSTGGSTIHYTTDGSTPTTSSAVYSSPINVSVSETVKAIATASGYAQSAVRSAVYSIVLSQTATPTFSPVAGSYNAVQTVSISCSTSGSSIFYTTDGTTPTTSSSVYSSPISVSSSKTLKAIATASGFSQSAVGSAAYTITISQTATPTFSPAAGSYSSVQTVNISCSTGGSTIHYTTDGSTPTTSSAVYSTALTVGSSETIKAIATAPGFTQSAVGSAAYTITISGLNFPLLGAQLYGQSGTSYVDNISKIAKTSLIGMQGWPGWRDPVHNNSDLAAVYAAIKAANPNAKIFQYVMMEAQFDTTFYASNFISDPPASVWYEQASQTQKAKWFAYANGATKSGNPVMSNFGNNNFPEWNWTIYGNTYQGKTWTQFAMDFFKKVYKDGGTALGSATTNLTQSVNPNISGFMADNQFWQYRIGADYNCDGTTDSPATNATYQSQCRNGNKVAMAYLRSIWPGVIIMGNLDWINPVSQGFTSVAGTEWENVYDGALNESMMGQPYSAETWSNFKTVMQTYILMMNTLIGPKLGTNMTDFILSAGYALQRYAFTFTLMNNGYHFSNDPNNGGYSTTGMILLDEYNFNLGAAIDAPQTAGRFSFNTSTWEGIWVREFQNGYAICGARRSTGAGADAYHLNGDQTTAYPTFTLPVNTQRLTGSQDPATNNGATIPAGTPITMTPRNGLILKKI